MKRKALISSVFTALTIFICFLLALQRTAEAAKTAASPIRYVDFGVTAAAMQDALQVTLSHYGTEHPADFAGLLATLGAKYGGDFSRYKKSDLEKIALRLENGESLTEINRNSQYYSYYRKAYGAVLDGFVGEYRQNGEKRYGLTVYSPVAAGFDYAHYDDFGASRTYGYKREHLGHDLMGSVGTPIAAVESGYVEAIGWNQYGGWRIGIRSFDNRRYYYYAHLRKDHPYTDIREGDIIYAGQIIGYMGMTGYSIKENVNNIDTPHLHFGIQLIFDPTQKDGDNQIWIDCYEIVKFLSRNRVKAVKQENGEWAAADPVFIDALPD